MASRADDFERSEIVGSFLDEVSSYLPQIGASLDRLQQAPGDLAAVEGAFRCTHTIAGSAALMGYPALAHLAHGMEETLGAVLDARGSLPVPTVALLRRSFGRLERLLQQIRMGKMGNEDARLVAEDDADRASWRGGMTGALGVMPSGPPSRPAGSSSSRWQTSGAQAGGIADVPTQRAPVAPGPGAASGPRVQAGQRSNGQAALGPTNRLAEADTAVVPQWQAANAAGAAGGAQSQAGRDRRAERLAQPSNAPQGQPGAPLSAGAARGASAAIDGMRNDTEIMRRHVAALRDGIARVREAAQTMENERAELRAFLDGSQDALARLEEWAGRQMGLDLAGSPEAVRRYLPLSVIWVTTTRLKRLAGLLQTAGRDLAGSEEQIDATLRELRASIEATAALAGGAALVSGSPESGFSATIAQFSWMPPAGTAGTAGDPRVVDSMPSALDAERALGPGTRAELERQVREELRRSLEDDVRDEIAASVRREAEARLRHELEIEVRRQFLATLNPALGTGGAAEAAQTMAQMPIGERGPRAIQVTSEQSPEAMEIFRDEAQEHLQTITTGIAQLERAPGNMAAMHPIRRAMHTLKGAAGMMGFGAIQTLAHASEDLLDRLAGGAISFSPAIMKLILDTSDALDQLISGQVKRPEDQQKLVRSLTDRYSALTGAPVSTPPPPTAAPISVRRNSHKPAAQAVAAAAGDDVDLSVRLQLSKLDDLVNLFGELLVTRATVEERVTRMNALVSDAVLAGERLRDIGSQLETRIEVTELPSGRPAGNPPDLTGAPTGRSGNSGGPGGSGGWRPFARNSPGPHTRDFDELEMDRYTEFHRLSRGLSESVTDVVTLNQEMESLLREMQTAFVRENRLSSDFQDRLLKARLVPLQSLIPRLYRSVRATALAEGKEVEFFVEGGDTEVDRKVIEEVEAPLLHLVRNAVSHGIEKPEVRAKRRKPRVGKVTIVASYEGNQVVVAVRDDGAGIDPDKIRSTAVARGWIERNAKLSDKEAINLLFQPGVTTATSVTEQSGRGVGLDVVRDVVGHRRGTVEVDSHPGQGTTFTMKFPITLQIARTVLVRVGPQTVAIPMAVVEQIGRLDYYQRVPGQSALELRSGQYPVVHLASYLNVPQGRIDDRSPVLLVNTGTQRVAVLVDAIVNQQELVRKPLGAHLRDVRGIAGAAVLGNGQVVLILELHELFAGQPLVPVSLPEPGSTSGPPTPTPTPISMQPTAPLGLGTSSGPARSQPARTSPPVRSGVASMPSRVEMPAAVARSYVLVVDDSPSVRRVVSGMFRANGWNVQVARDGVEALDLIAKERPAAVLLDIEMPRMDGYELMATLRSQEQYKTVPLIVLTSRAATKHQQRAMQLGADDYVVKPYQEHELLGTIARLVQARGR